jgi:hypothetical protein
MWRDLLLQLAPPPTSVPVATWGSCFSFSSSLSAKLQSGEPMSTSGHMEWALLLSASTYGHVAIKKKRLSAVSTSLLTGTGTPLLN